jgi:hypothetical protein
LANLRHHALGRRNRRAIVPRRRRRPQHFVIKPARRGFSAPGWAATGGFPAAADATMIFGSLVLGSSQSLIPSSINSLPLGTL